ncbi:unnamed protein product [Effrenium voratum]|nr:unnamed protein product [Effrenium voratum]
MDRSIGGRPAGGSCDLGGWTPLWQQALQVFAELRAQGGAPSLHAHCAALAALGNAAHWRGAVEMYGEALAGLEPDAALHGAATMAALAQGRQWRLAVWLLDTLPEADRSVPLVTSFLRAAAGKWQFALLTLAQLRRQLRLDAPALNAAIGACAEGQAWRSALAILQAMRRGSPRPDGGSFNGALAACAAASRWQAALSLLPAMREATLAPDDVSFNACIHACEGASLWQRALSLLKTPRLESLNTAASACGKASVWGLSLALLRRAEEAALELSEVSYNVYLNACLHSSKWDLALLPKAKAVSVLALHDRLGACERAGAGQAVVLRAQEGLRRAVRRAPPSVSGLRSLVPGPWERGSPPTDEQRWVQRAEQAPALGTLRRLRAEGPPAPQQALPPATDLVSPELARRLLADLALDLVFESFRWVLPLRPGMAALCHAGLFLVLACCELFQIREPLAEELALISATFLLAAVLPLFLLTLGLWRRRIWHSPPLLLALIALLPCASGVCGRLLWNNRANNRADAVQLDLLKAAALQLATAAIFRQPLLARAVSALVSVVALVLMLLPELLEGRLELVEGLLLYVVFSFASLAIWSPHSKRCGLWRAVAQAASVREQDATCWTPQQLFRPLLGAPGLRGEQGLSQVILRQRLCRQLQELGFQASHAYFLGDDARAGLVDMVELVQSSIGRCLEMQDSRLDVSQCPPLLQDWLQQNFSRSVSEGSNLLDSGKVDMKKATRKFREKFQSGGSSNSKSNVGPSIPEHAQSLVGAEFHEEDMPHVPSDSEVHTEDDYAYPHIVSAMMSVLRYSGEGVAPLVPQGAPGAGARGYPGGGGSHALEELRAALAHLPEDAPRLPNKHFPGTLDVYGSAVPVAGAAKSRGCSVACAEVGPGRLVVFSENTWLKEDHMGDFSHALLTWAGKGHEHHVMKVFGDFKDDHEQKKATEELREGKGVAVVAAAWSQMHKRHAKDLSFLRLQKWLSEDLDCGISFTKGHAGSNQRLIREAEAEEVIVLQPSNLLKCKKGSKWYPQDPTKVVWASHKFNQANHCYGKAGWWCPRVQHDLSVVVDLGGTMVDRIWLRCKQKNVAPKDIEISKCLLAELRYETVESAPWEIVGSFVFDADHDHAEFQLSQPHGARYWRFTSKCNHGGACTGINGLKFGIEDDVFCLDTKGEPQALVEKFCYAQIPQQKKKEEIERFCQRVWSSCARPHIALDVHSNSQESKAFMAAIDGLLLASEDNRLLQLMDQTKLFPSYGFIPRPDQLVEVRMEVTEGRDKWLSTGCYLAPGHRLTVTRVGGEGSIEVQVGCHTDSVSKLESWHRLPRVVKKSQLKKQDNSISLFSALGGMVYLLPEEGSATVQLSSDAGLAKALCFDVENPMPAPEWDFRRQQPQAPWSELICRNVIFVMPSSYICEVEGKDLVELCGFWDAVLEAHFALAGKRKRRFRAVVDKAISHGFMHAGYPVMITETEHTCDSLVNLDNLKSVGSWGVFHEFGHNMQEQNWVFDGSVEVSVNFFTLHAMEKVVGTETFDNHIVQKGLAKFDNFKKDGKPWDRWTDDPVLALLTFAMLREREGSWDPFHKTMVQYLQEGPEKINDDEEKRKLFFQRLNANCSKDHSDLWVDWGISF